MAFSEFIDYLTIEKNYSQHTILAYEKDLQDFSDFIEEEFSQSEIISVNYGMIRSWIIQLVDSGLANRSINRKMSSLKSYYRFLQRTKQLEVSPMQKHRVLKTSKKLQIPFSIAEVQQALDLFKAEGFEETRNKLMVELLYTTGMRRAELIQLKVNDLSLSKGTLKVLGKRNKERMLPMLPSVKKTLGLYLEERDKLDSIIDDQYLLLTTKGKKVYESLVYNLVNSYFSSVSGKSKKSPHILRHSFATHLLNEGANLNAVKELLGHSSLASTEVYTHNSIGQLKKVYKNAHPRNRKE